jgi:hypothetical protein
MKRICSGSFSHILSSYFTVRISQESYSCVHETQTSSSVFILSASGVLLFSPAYRLQAPCMQMPFTSAWRSWLAKFYCLIDFRHAPMNLDSLWTVSWRRTYIMSWMYQVIMLAGGQERQRNQLFWSQNCNVLTVKMTTFMILLRPQSTALHTKKSYSGECLSKVLAASPWWWWGSDESSESQPPDQCCLSSSHRALLSFPDGPGLAWRLPRMQCNKSA